VWCLPENTHLIAQLLSASRLVSTQAKSLPALGGTVTYSGADPIELEATLSGGSSYTVENQWGSTDSDWNPGGVFVLGSRKRSDALSGRSGFPEGYFYLTTKSAEKQRFVLESAPLTLKKIGNYTGMFWKATPAKDSYFYLTSRFLEEKNEVLEGTDGNSAAAMMPRKGVTGTQWKAIPTGNGYYYLTTKFMEEQGKVLDGNVGEPEDAASAPFKGVPYMVDRQAAGPSAQWKFIRRGDAVQVDSDE